MSSKNARRRGTTQKDKASAVKAKEDDGPELFCICQQPYDSRRFMIGCDHCNGWFHARCVNITVAEAERLENFICPPCKQKRKRKEKTDRGKKGKSKGSSAASRSGGVARGSAEYRPPSRKPSQRIKRHEVRKAQTSNDQPYEPNFDTSDSEADGRIGEQNNNKIPKIPDPEPSDSEASAEMGVSTKDHTLSVDVHAYAITAEDLGANLDLSSLTADDRDEKLIAHLKQRAFEIEASLHRTQSLAQIKKSGLAFARRKTLELQTENLLKKHKGSEIPDFSDEKADDLLRGINKVRQLREVSEHCIKCPVSKGYIPIPDFEKHLVECAMQQVLKIEENSSTLKKKIIRKRKLQQKLEICGCPLLPQGGEEGEGEEGKNKMGQEGLLTEKEKEEDSKAAEQPLATNGDVAAAAAPNASVATTGAAAKSPSSGGPEAMEEDKDTTAGDDEKKKENSNNTEVGGGGGGGGAASTSPDAAASAADATATAGDSAKTDNGSTAPPPAAAAPAAAPAAAAVPPADEGATGPKSAATSNSMEVEKKQQRKNNNTPVVKTEKISTRSSFEPSKSNSNTAAPPNGANYTLLPWVTRGIITADGCKYCDKLRSDCSQHVGWESLWDAEISQQWFFHSKRLELVKEEIEAVESARSERRREIEIAKRKTENNEVNVGNGSMRNNGPPPPQQQQQHQHQALQQQQHQAALHQHQQLPPPGPRGMERDVIMEGPHSIVRQPPNIDMKMQQQLSLHEGIRRPPPMQNGGMGGADRLRGRMGAQAGAYGGADTKPMFMGGQ